MTVGDLIKELLTYDASKEVLFMKEYKDDDLTYADEITCIEQ